MKIYYNFMMLIIIIIIIIYLFIYLYFKDIVLNMISNINIWQCTSTTFLITAVELYYLVWF